MATGLADAREVDGAANPDDVIRLKVPSCKGSLQKTISRVLSRLNQTKLDMWFMRLAVEEALVNAVEHGNKFDQSKEVHFEIRQSGNSCRITVRDEGEGFNPDSLSDPVPIQKHRRSRGYGVFLMRKIMDEVIYSGDGTEVTLVKNY